ncbi:Ion-translocating oxidoreductase complex subunit D [Candidatus Magnetomoraceae bacterium gMMP-1]
MNNTKKFVVSHAPYYHNGSSISARNYHTILAALPAVLAGICYYGMPALRVVAFAVGCAMFWEMGLNYITKRPLTTVDGSAALIGLLFAMLLPATVPWWFVVIGSFAAVIIGREIYGGIGGNPFNPALTAVAILMLSWPFMFDFYDRLANYDTCFAMAYPLEALKYFGPDAISGLSISDLLMGKQPGAIGATFGLGLIIGGIYLILRGFIRWEIPVSFIVGLVITAHLFSMSDPSKYAGPMFHLFTGYTLIGVFFLATEDSSSPVNFVPMLIYGAGAGFMTVLIRNIGAYVDGVVFAILLMNLANPLLDRIRPKAFGKVIKNA